MDELYESYFSSLFVYEDTFFHNVDLDFEDDAEDIPVILIKKLTIFDG